MKRVSRLWDAYWPTTFIVIGLAAALGFLLLFRLGSIAGGISQNEYQQQLFSSSWHHIVSNPLYLPLTATQWVILTIFSHHGNTVTRLASPIFGVLTILAFAYVLRRWYGVRTALYGTLLFVCSAWFLHVSRYAGVDILYLWAIPTLLASLIIWEEHSRNLFVRLALVIMTAMMFYIPGMALLVLVAMGLQFHQVTQGWRQINTWHERAITASLFAFLLLPLVYAGIRTPSIMQTWLGLPHTFDLAINVVKRLGLSVTYLFYHGPGTPTVWLDRLPVLDIFAVIMAVLGIFFYLRHIGASRTRLLLGLFFVGTVLFALQGPVSYSILIPIVYFVVVAGIGYLLHEWLHVFPRNPLARSIGFGLLALAIVLACAYNLRAYFVAWPHNQATITTFVHHQ